MTPFIVLCMVVSFCSAVVRWLKKAANETPSGGTAFARHGMTVRLDLGRTKPIAAAFFRNQGWRLGSETGFTQRFTRGDTGIRRLPTYRQVPWAEIPLTLTLTYRDADGGTLVEIEFRTQPLESCDQDCLDFILRHAEEEFNEALAHVDAAVQRLRQGGGEPHSKDERVGGYRQARERAAAFMADFEALGLTLKATWEEVKTAYHEACHKYHPDRLTGVPKHLVDLAVTRFKSISDAYQRLKEHFRS